MMILIFLLIYIAEAVIYWQYCSSLLTPKHTKTYCLISLVVTYIILFIISLLKYPILNMFSFLLFNILYMKLTYRIRFIHSLFHATAACTIMNFSELIVLNLLPANNHGVFDGTYSISNLFILASLSKLVYFFIIRLTIHFLLSKDKELHISKKETWMLLLVPVISFFIFAAIIGVITTVQVPIITSTFLSLGSVLLLLLNFIIYHIFYFISEKNKEYLSLELETQHNNDMTLYHQKLLEQDEAQKVIIHDIKKHLISLQSLSTDKEVSSYIKNIINTEAFHPSIRICNHDLLNSILCRYTARSQNCHTSFSADIRTNCVDFLPNEDITGLFCNLLDNAFEATHDIPNAYIELSVTHPENTSGMTLSLLNSCSKDPFSKSDRKLTTPKSNSQKHGFGLKSIERIVAKHDGITKMYFDSNTYIFHTIIYFKSSL